MNKQGLLYASSGTSIVSYIISNITLSQVALIVSIVSGIAALIIALTTGLSNHRKNIAEKQKLNLESEEIRLRINILKKNNL